MSISPMIEKFNMKHFSKVWQAVSGSSEITQYEFTGHKSYCSTTVRVVFPSWGLACEWNL